MSTLSNILSLLLTLVPIGGAMRIVILCIQWEFDQDDENKYKTRIKNVLIFVAIAVSVRAIRQLIITYY